MQRIQVMTYLKLKMLMKGKPSHNIIFSHVSSGQNSVNSAKQASTSFVTAANAELGIPFARAKLGPFLQEQPKLGNQYTEDVTLRGYLKRYIPQQVLPEIENDLIRFGERVSTDIYNLAVECEKNPPKLEQFDAWGKRQDKLITSEAWKKQKQICAEEGIVAIAYERKYGSVSRLYQMAKNYLYSPSSGLYSCPIAMTDGAAKSLEVIGNKTLLERAYSGLTSRDPNKFWTSGQWMTERKGGSDVAGGCETIAVPQSDGSFKLYGYKWFSSATDSDMTLTLARVVDSNGKMTPGSRGISMFYLETRDQHGQLNGMEVMRLKDKLGTRQLPTAELLLDGTVAYKVSDDGRGVSGITKMLSLTRLHLVISCAGSMRRITNLAKDYSTKRECLGKMIKDHALHVKTLANMEVETRAATLLALELARLLGKDDCNEITEHELDLLRILTPVGKLYAAKQGVAVASEGLECFGGAGYLEDTHLPVILRDAQVQTIWEGTTNILSLDILRAIGKSKGGALEAFIAEINQRLDSNNIHPELHACVAKVKQAAGLIGEFAVQNVDNLEIASREFAFSLGRTYMGMLLIDHASWSGAGPTDIFAAKRWCEKDLLPVIQAHKEDQYSDNTIALESQIVYEGYVPTSKL